MSSSDPRADVTVYNLWGSWCSPCRAEAPVLRSVARASAADGVRFIGLNLRDNESAARAFEREFKIPYPSIGGQAAAEAVLEFGSAAASMTIPSTLIVNRDGELTARILGEVSEVTLRTLIDDARSTPPVAAPSTPRQETTTSP